MKPSGRHKSNWRVYLLNCADQTLYCGITKDLESRLLSHNTGRGARYTRGRLPVSVAAVSSEMTKADALRLEMRVKKLPAARKIDALAKGPDPK